MCRKAQRRPTAGCVHGTLASLAVVSEVCLKRVRQIYFGGRPVKTSKGGFTFNVKGNRMPVVLLSPGSSRMKSSITDWDQEDTGYCLQPAIVRVMPVS